MKKILILVLVSLAVLLSSCAHNGLLVAKGKVFMLNETGFTFVNGTLIADASRENTQLKVNVSDDDNINKDAENGIKGDIEVERRIDKQISGYLRDLAEKSPEAALSYLKLGKIENNKK